LTVWPDGKQAAAFFSFDVDGESVWINIDERNAQLPVTMSQAQYGPQVGVFEILRILRKHQVPATFFVPTATAERYPNTLAAIVEEGHEVGLHGDVHEPPHMLEPKQEQEILDRTIEILERMTGTRPVGYRAPWVEASANTTRLLADRNLLYDSSFMHDVFPYYHQHGDDGDALVELPIHWTTDDWTYSMISPNSYGGPEVNVVRPAAEVVAIWSDVRAGILEMGGLFCTIAHPQISGRPNRLCVLDEVIGSTKEDGRFWIAGGAEIAKWWKESGASAPTGQERLNR
jgi:peptidoglycan-N-acetylglucosamine deacetylase